MKDTNGAQAATDEHPDAPKVAPRFTRAVNAERSRLEGKRAQLLRKREAAQAELGQIDRAVGATVNSIDGSTPGFSQAVPVYPNSNGGDVRFNDKYPLPATPAAPVLQLPLTRSTNLYLANPNLKAGYVHSYSLNVQRQLDSKTVLQVGYVGNRGVKLFMDVDENQPRIYGDFLNSFKEIQAYVNNSALPVSSGNVFVKLYGSAAAAVSALNATNFRNGLVGTIANTVDRNQYTRYAAAGIKRSFLQDNLSRSSYGILRGLHLQNPRAQGKLVSAIRGKVLDVAVDVRVGSPTFGRHVSVEL